MSTYEGIALNLRTMAMSLPLEIHNWYYATTLNNGLPALLVLIVFVLLYLVKIWRNKNNYLKSLSVIGVIICSLVAGVFQPFFNFGIILLLLSLANGDNIKSPNVKKGN